MEEDGGLRCANPPYELSGSANPQVISNTKTGTLRLRSKSRSAIQLPEYTALSLTFHVTVTCLKQCPAIGFRGVFGMADVALPGSIEPAARAGGPKLDHGINPLQGIIYAGVV